MEFFTADLHFDDENIIKYYHRPFKDVDEMNQRLIDNIVEKFKTCKTDYYPTQANPIKFFILGDFGNEDYLEPSKAIYEFTKNNDYYKIKGGVIEGKVMTAEEIITLAKLPSKETLLSMLAGALLANIQKFAVALDQVRIQKEEGSAEETTAEA